MNKDLVKRIIALIIVLCVVNSSTILAQDTSCVRPVTILVKDYNSKLPVAGSEITYKGRSGFTDEYGMIQLPLPCTMHLVYADLQIEHQPLHANQMTYSGDTVEIVIKEETKQLDGVVVMSKKREASLNAQESLTTEEMLRQRGKSIAEMATNLPGVTMLQTGAEIAKPMINGMSNNRILIINNGVRQEGQQWGAEHAPEIDAMQVSHLTVIKGAEAIRYGRDAIGGVLLVSPTSLPYGDTKWQGSATVIGSTNARKGIVDVQLGKAFGKDNQWAWRAQTSASRAGNYQTADYFLDNTGMKSFNYSAALGYQKNKWKVEAFYSHYNSEVGIFKGAHIGDTTDLEARIRNGRPFDNGSFYYQIAAPRQVVEHDLAKLNAIYHLNNSWDVNAQYSFQHDRRQEYDLRRQGLSALPSVDLTLLYQNLKLEAVNQFGTWKNIYGLEGDIYVNNNRPNLFVVPLIPNYDSRALGAYAISKHTGKKVDWEAGLRYDYYNLSAAGFDLYNHLYGGERSFGKLNASIGMSKHIFGQLHWYSNLGSAWRPPSVNELYSAGLHHGAAEYEIGDSTLKAEQSYKWMNSFKWNSTKPDLQIQLDAYAQYFSNYIFLNPTLTFTQSLRGAFPVFDYKSTSAFFWGMDLDLRWASTHPLSYEFKGSVIRAKDVKNNRYLPFIPSDRISQTVFYNAKWNNGLNTWGLWLRNDIVARQIRYEANSDYAPPPKGYTLFAIGASTNVQLGKHQLNVNLGVENMFNTLYKDYLNRYRYYAHDLGRNISLKINYIL